MAFSGDFLSKKTTFTIPLCHRSISKQLSSVRILGGAGRRSSLQLMTCDSGQDVRRRGSWESCETAGLLLSPRPFKCRSPLLMLICLEDGYCVFFCNALKPGTLEHSSFVWKEKRKTNRHMIARCRVRIRRNPPLCCHCFITTRW